MVAVLILGGLVLGVVSALGTRLQRQLRDSRSRIEVAEELSAGAALLPPPLQALSSSAGDIRAGEARDTSIEFRAAIANGIVCSGATSSLVIAPYLLVSGRRAASSAQPGDTLWLLTDSDTLETWQPTQIRALRGAVGSCPAITDQAGREVFDVDHLLAVEVRDSVSTAVGAVSFVSRPIRYSFYGASDGRWYLGVRTWSTSIGQFNVIQPLSGPFAPPSGGTRMEYYDSNGSILPSGVMDTRRIRRIEVLLPSAFPSGKTRAIDSVRVVAAIRNAR